MNNLTAIPAIRFSQKCQDKTVTYLSCGRWNTIRSRNKMSKENLAKILGPTVVGYSSVDPSPLEMIGETPVLARCMEKLLELKC